MQYEITFSLDEHISKEYGVSPTYSFLAKPIMSKDQSRRKNRKEFEQKMEEYALLLKQNEEEKERVKMQADMVNAFSINQTGIWNIDKIMKEEVIITKVYFDFEGEMKGMKSEHKIFMIFEDNNSVIYVSRSEWDKIPFPINKHVSIAAVINNSKVAFIPSEDIRNIVKRGYHEISLTSKRINYHDFAKRLN
jgi:hypothetical protein